MARIQEGFERYRQSNPGATLSSWAREAFELKMQLDERVANSPVIHEAQARIHEEAKRLLLDTVYPLTPPVKRGK